MTRPTSDVDLVRQKENQLEAENNKLASKFVSLITCKAEYSDEIADLNDRIKRKKDALELVFNAKSSDGAFRRARPPPASSPGIAS